MVKEVNRKLNSKDKKVIDVFVDLGMPRNLAKTLIYISEADECRSAEIERNASLRQPEVSVAMQELQRRGWIKKRDLKKKGKGRPVHLYRLSSSIDSIVGDFEKQKLQEINHVKKDLSELKKLIED
jgi:predicted transcriptional regulator